MSDPPLTSCTAGCCGFQQQCRRGDLSAALLERQLFDQVRAKSHFMGNKDLSLHSSYYKPFPPFSSTNINEDHFLVKSLAVSV